MDAASRVVSTRFVPAYQRPSIAQRTANPFLTRTGAARPGSLRLLRAASSDSHTRCSDNPRPSRVLLNHHQPTNVVHRRAEGGSTKPQMDADGREASRHQGIKGSRHRGTRHGDIGVMGGISPGLGPGGGKGGKGDGCSEPGCVNPVRARIPETVHRATNRQPIPHADRGGTPRLA